MTLSSIAITDRAVATLHVPGSADFFVADGASVWITNHDRVEKLDRAYADPVATVHMPSPCGVMANGFGAIWVAGCQDHAVYRIDARAARVTAVIPTGLADPEGELSLAASEDAVWVLSDRAGVLSRIDPATNTVVQRIAVAPHSYAAAYGFGAVWITNTGEPQTTRAGSVQRIDPATNRIVATIDVGVTPRFLAVGEGGVWTLNQGDGSVSRIDPAANRVVSTIHVPGTAGEGGDIAAGAGRVWVRTSGALLSAIDPLTDQVVEQFGPPCGSGGVCVAHGLVWVSAHDIQRVWALGEKGERVDG